MANYCMPWYENDAEELVTTVTGLEDGENFERCMDFVISNLNYHTYLDVNSHKVTRAIDGLYDKFLIHSQNRKAETFRNLCTTFLASPVFKDHSARDVQFSLLSLLFELSNNPTNSDYTSTADRTCEKEKTVAIKDVNDPECDCNDVRFPSSLAYFSDWSDDDLSDYLNDGGPDSRSSVPTSEKEDQAINATDRLNVQTHSQLLMPMVNPAASELRTSGRSWLSRQLQVPYWSNISSNDQASQSQSSSLSANLRRQWEGYVSNSMPIIHFGGAVELSERQLIREILWMLQGRKETFLFKMGVDGALCVNPKISISHLTKNTLSNMLQPLAKIGTSLFKLRGFVETAGATFEMSSDSDTIQQEGARFAHIQTYNAFAVALCEWLLLFTERVKDMERVLVLQEETLTFSMVLEQLEQPWFDCLDTVLAIYQAGIESVGADKPSWFRASHLLNVLYLAIEQIGVTGEAVQNKAAIATAMFLKTIRPYLEIIDTWMTVGSLVDPCHEFVVERNKQVTSLDEKFWDTSIVIRRHHSGKDVMVLFLRPVLKTIILIGKSMELLHCLGKLQQVTQHMVQGSSSTLYKTFANRLTWLLNVGSHNCVNLISDNAEESYSSMQSESESDLTLDNSRRDMKKILESQDVYDPIMTKLMLEQFVEGLTEHVESRSSTATEEYDLKQLIDIVNVSRVRIITDAINSAITPNIQEKYEYVCQKLIDIFKTEYHLQDCLLAMRKYFLMEKGDVLFHFYSQVFEKISPGSLSVQDEMNINIILEDALLSYCPEDVSKLTVRVDDSMGGHQVVNKIDSYRQIVFVYNIAWPLDIIINTACRDRYSKIFAFLLQIKQAKYCLDELRFHELLPPALNWRRHSFSTKQHEIGTKEILNSIQLFRVKLLYFVNTLHSHLMTRILHSTEPILEKLLNSTTSDLQLIISAHEEYVENIFQQSLLHPRMAILKENIVKILNLALVFGDCWKSGVDHVSWDCLREMDQDITSCQKFLQSFVRHLAPKGNLLYLESMVDDLAAHKETPFLFF